MVKVFGLKKTLKWLEHRTEGRLEQFCSFLIWFFGAYSYPFPERVSLLWRIYWQFWWPWSDQNARISHYAAPWNRQTWASSCQTWAVAYWDSPGFHEWGPGVLPPWPALPWPLFSGGDFNALPDEILEEEKM